MLKRIVAITFIALLSPAFAGTSIAEDTKQSIEQKKQTEAIKANKKALEGASAVRTSPQQGAGPKGTTSHGASGRK